MELGYSQTPPPLSSQPLRRTNETVDQVIVECDHIRLHSDRLTGCLAGWLFMALYVTLVLVSFSSCFTQDPLVYFVIFTFH